jgi:hypothetical protein
MSGYLPMQKLRLPLNSLLAMEKLITIGASWTRCWTPIRAAEP